MNQSKVEQIHEAGAQRRKNAYRLVTIGFGFTFDWSRKWREIF